ncbi:MAG: hypothetical protein KJO11_08445 [Gemmatimonadetes bacterium]|nr:hypothetical protein [Gemmatimonadota bacterium]MBT8403678.1 hypothetical protein [Gemmatimonadota bacterium]
MRRLLIALLAGASLNACGGEPPQEPAAEAIEPSAPTPALPGARSIDRARGAAAAASERALRHDTIR